MRDSAYLVLALSALRSDVGALGAAATALSHGKSRDARWWLARADSSGWIRGLLSHSLKPLNTH